MSAQRIDARAWCVIASSLAEQLTPAICEVVNSAERRSVLLEVAIRAAGEAGDGASLQVLQLPSRREVLLVVAAGAVAPDVAHARFLAVADTIDGFGEWLVVRFDTRAMVA